MKYPAITAAGLALALLMTPGAVRAEETQISDYIREQQHRFVQRSDAGDWLHSFTDKDLLRLENQFDAYRGEILPDNMRRQLTEFLNRLPAAAAAAVLEAAEETADPTWEEAGGLREGAQTQAGQTAQKMIAMYITDALRKSVEKSEYMGGMQAQEWKLAWQDAFEGNSAAPDPSLWGFDTGSGGWGNDELQTYTRSAENVRVAGGQMILSARKRPEGGYSSARVVTRDKMTVASGRVEIRASLPSGQGIWPALWLLPQNDTYHNWEKNGELDIAELIGSEPEFVYGSLHSWIDGKFTSLSNGFHLEGQVLAGVPHVFAVSWDTHHVQWEVDGHTYASYSLDKLYPDRSYQPLAQPFYLLMNIAVGGTWPGDPDKETVFPAEMKVDYVRVYSKVPAENAVSDWARAYVTKAGKDGLVDGNYQMGAWKDVMTREAAAVLAVRAAGRDSATPVTAVFEDSVVPEVTHAKRLGLVSGISSTEFRPKASITREEFATILYKTMRLTHPNMPARHDNLTSFSDSFKISEWARVPVASLVAHGLMKGDGMFLRPQDEVTLEEALTMIVKLKEME